MLERPSPPSWTRSPKKPRPGHAPLAPAAGPLRHPEVDQPGDASPENFDVFDFELGADELAAIDALDTGVRNGPDPDEAREERFAMVIPEA